MECVNCSYYVYCQNGQYCIKVGGPTLINGYCGDVQNERINKKNTSNKKKRNKRIRDYKYRNHLKFLAKNVAEFPAPVIYTNKVWINGIGYVDNPKPYYKRLYRSRGRRSNSNFCKKMSNRKIRRYRGELHKNGNMFHKLYDYWWKFL